MRGLRVQTYQGHHGSLRHWQILGHSIAACLLLPRLDSRSPLDPQALLGRCGLVGQGNARRACADTPAIYLQATNDQSSTRTLMLLTWLSPDGRHY